MNTPIRILHVVTYMGRGGLESMLMQYYRHIDRSLVQFDFLVHREFQADFDHEIQALGGKIHRLPRMIPWSRHYQKALRSFFAAHPEYRIVHVHQDCLSSVILKAAEQSGVPVRIAHSHSSAQTKDLKYPIRLYYKRQIPRYATQLFACSKAAGHWMFDGHRYQILPNAIDLDRYSPDRQLRLAMRRQLGISENAFVVGHVGRFHPVKNHAFLLQIFAQVKKQQRDAVLLLIGDGPLRPAMEKRAQKLGVGDSVIFTGVRSDVPQLLQAMDVFAFPSRHEGFPVTLVEAQAAGLPCVISDGVPPECAVAHGVVRLARKAGVQRWAEQICAIEKPQQDPAQILAQAGYAIESNSLWLQKTYLELWERNA